jgi:hypothetical protein
MLDMSDVISDPDFGVEYSVRRPPQSSFQAEGVWTAGGAPTVISLSSPLQPSRGVDVAQFLPEGERAKRSISIWSPVEIFMSDGEGRDADQIVYNGETYRVAFAKRWGAQGNYWFSMATLVSAAGA